MRRASATGSGTRSSGRTYHRILAITVVTCFLVIAAAGPTALLASGINPDVQIYLQPTPVNGNWVYEVWLYWENITLPIGGSVRLQRVTVYELANGTPAVLADLAVPGQGIELNSTSSLSLDLLEWPLNRSLPGQAEQGVTVVLTMLHGGAGGQVVQATIQTEMLVITTQPIALFWGPMVIIAFALAIFMLVISAGLAFNKRRPRN